MVKVGVFVVNVLENSVSDAKNCKGYKAMKKQKFFIC
jgi:hypothetical protein